MSDTLESLRAELKNERRFEGTPGSARRPALWELLTRYDAALTVAEQNNAMNDAALKYSAKIKDAMQERMEAADKCQGQLWRELRDVSYRLAAELQKVATLRDALIAAHPFVTEANTWARISAVLETRP